MMTNTEQTAWLESYVKTLPWRACLWHYKRKDGDTYSILCPNCKDGTGSVPYASLAEYADAHGIEVVWRKVTPPAVHFTKLDLDYYPEEIDEPTISVLDALGIVEREHKWVLIRCGAGWAVTRKGVEQVEEAPNLPELLDRVREAIE